MKLFTLNLRKAMVGLAVCLTVMGASGAVAVLCAKEAKAKKEEEKVNG